MAITECTCKLPFAKLAAIAPSSGTGPRIEHIWTWLLHDSTADHVSLAVSTLALVGAFWAGYQAKRSASATEEQARAAEDQAHETLRAGNQAEKAAREAKAVTWHDISDRLMERTARVVIGIEGLNWPPIIVGDIPRDLEYPRSPEPDQPKVFKSRSWNDRHSEVYCWVRGIIINEDTRPIQFIPLGGISLIDGTTSLIDGTIKVPPKMHPIEGRYLLAPGQAALFEWRASLMVKQWIEYFNDEKRAPLPSAGVVAYPAGDPDTSSYIRMRLEGCPLTNNGANDEVWELDEHPLMFAQVHSPRLIPPAPLAGLLLSLDDSGSAENNPTTWNLDIWQRDMLDLW